MIIDRFSSRLQLLNQMALHLCVWCPITAFLEAAFRDIPSKGSQFCHHSSLLGIEQRLLSCKFPENVLAIICTSLTTF